MTDADARAGVGDDVPESAPARRSFPARLRRLFHRAAVRQRQTRRTLPARLASAGIVMLAAMMIVISARTSQGIDLRPSRNTDLVWLVREQAARAQRLNQDAARLRSQVDALSAGIGTGPARSVLDEAARSAGLTAVHGPAIEVTLNDAPASVEPVGVDADVLVVHQQDIQAVANVLWSAGAEAMMIQGQRVTARTGIKCVGNTVVLHGVPYAPPYVIVAIGDPDRMQRALSASASIAVYKQYVDAYQLGYAERRRADAVLPAYDGSLDTRYASPAR